MSRSRKKNPILKDGCKAIRQTGHRKLRRKVRMQIQRGDEVLRTLREEQNQYDVIDWKEIPDASYSAEKVRKMRRK